MSAGRRVDLAPTPPRGLAEPSPAGDAHHTDAFVVVVAKFCAASGRHEWAERLLRLADEVVPKDEQHKRRLAKRDALIWELANKFYSTIAGFRPRARIIEADLAAAAADALSPSSIEKNFLLREILDLSEDEVASFETIRKILARVG
jgi:hypothetical protein